MQKTRTATKGKVVRAIERAAQVFIVDDHELLRQGLRLMIDNEFGLECCGEAADEAGAIDQIRESRPDLVIVDIGLKSGNGLDLIRRIKAHDLSINVIVQTMYDERLYGERALRAGAKGYVNKQDPARTILYAAFRVLDGKTYFSEELTDRVLHRAMRGDESLEVSPMEQLSDRELEVFQLIGEGLTTVQIAERIHLSRSTVETYRERLKIKLDMQTGPELSRQATQWVLENS